MQYRTPLERRQLSVIVFTTGQSGAMYHAAVPRRAGGFSSSSLGEEHGPDLGSGLSRCCCCRSIFRESRAAP